MLVSYFFIFFENRISVLILYFFVTYNLAMNKTLLGETGCINFLNSIPVPLTQSVRSHLVAFPALYSTFDLQDAMPIHISSSTFNPTQT